MMLACSICISSLLLSKSVLIAFTKIDTEFEPDTVVFAALRRLTVRMDAYPQQIKMQCIHTKSQDSFPILERHAPQGNVNFCLAGFFLSDSSAGANTTKGKRHIPMLDPRTQSPHHDSYSLMKPKPDDETDTG